MTCSPKTQVGCTFSYKGTIAIAIHLREKGITQHQCQVPGGPQSRPQQLRRERISRYHKGRFLAIKEELHGTRTTLSTPTVEAEGADSTIWIPGSKNKGLLTRSRTILVLRDPQNCITPWNYWPITSFQTTEESLRQHSKQTVYAVKMWASLRKAWEMTPEGQSTSLLLIKHQDLRPGRQAWAPRTNTWILDGLILSGMVYTKVIPCCCSAHSNMAKVLWDFELQTNKQLLTNRPIVMVVDK